jgi:hypothetical protein
VWVPASVDRRLGSLPLPLYLSLSHCLSRSRCCLGTEVPRREVGIDSSASLSAGIGMGMGNAVGVQGEVRMK